VYVNKQDLPNAIRVNELAEKLNLNTMTGRKWKIQSTVATTGVGLFEGFDW